LGINSQDANGTFQEVPDNRDAAHSEIIEGAGVGLKPGPAKIAKVAKIP
jgi:hypothetical protein